MLCLVYLVNWYVLSVNQFRIEKEINHYQWKSFNKVLMIKKYLKFIT